MDLIQKNLLEQVAGLHEIPEGAYNIRANGTKLGRNTTANIDIVTKTDKDGIDIIIKPGTVNESVHIPVLLSESGMQECGYSADYRLFVLGNRAVDQHRDSEGFPAWKAVHRPKGFYAGLSDKPILPPYPPKDPSPKGIDGYI